MACPSTWNPADKDSSFSLSEENIKATKTADGWALVRGLTSRNAGKLYFEVKADSMPGKMIIGIARSAANLASYLGVDEWGWGFYSDGSTIHNQSYINAGVTFGTGDIIQIAVDFSPGKVWFGKNNAWVLSGDPAAGSNPCYESAEIAGKDIFPGGSSQTIDSIFSLACCPTGQIYTPPAGFAAWTVPVSYKLSGTVKEAGGVVARIVRAYTRATGVLYSSGQSGEDGTFEIDAPDDTTEMFVVAFDDDAGDQYNALIYDRVKGVEV